ncbi:T9SS type A sorting domain-containing protein [Chryseobacterium sp. MFBS3-17]|uniref:T9SS type A sorting domain-containing protein n=1 Tax=Chryseobacterium sp. MFBS3-17 TaxID=2886689 RepID=UPI001D0F1172|nr:T9SS type A sorting domain-containing protein [Chryseobacterium sp. MFBS3-17]MCC2591695.1 T9SS type A sorting domain-containing protein [Chryseobacterium sp. MFBS3-17]
MAKLLSNGALILWGSTGASTKIVTHGAAFPAMIDPSPGKTFGFMAKFTLKEELSVAETGAGQDLVLYDNPNNGNFYLSGSVLQKEAATVQVYDFAGRLIVQKPLAKRKTQHIDLAGTLSAGTYMVKVSANQGTVLKTFKMVVNK